MSVAATTSPLLDAARAWYDAGYCVIPSHEDGGKRPFGQWKHYQTQRPDWAALEGWLSSGRYSGIGLIMGQASSNTEMIELEGPEDAVARRVDQLVTTAKHLDQQYGLGIEQLLTRAIFGCSETSAGGGLHTFVRITDGPVPGNTKLAMDDTKVIAETRGEGGFVIAWPTPARTGHKDGAVYLLLPDTHPSRTATITSEELELLHYLYSETFGGTPAPTPAKEPTKPTAAPSGALSPFDDYRARITWRDILEPAGWTWHSKDTEHDYWTRPGKNPRDGHSASTIEDGPLYLFSTSVAGMPTQVGLSKGQVYAHLHHGGDLAAATRQLRADGYGDPATEIPELAPWLIDNPHAGTIPEADLEAEYVITHLPAIDWHQLWADETEEEWIVYPLLPARRLVALYSAPKVGKSLLLLELAAGIATGRPLLGNPATDPATVLYVDFENDPKADIRERLQNMGYGPDDLGRLKLLSFPTMAALDSEKGSLELMAAIHFYGAQVVVIDTVSRAIAGEENENDTWLDFYRHTGLKLKQAGVALVRLDHSGKDETKGQRGGSAKSGDVDAVWRMSRTTDDLYDLICEANRLPIAERHITIRRIEEPVLAHQVVGDGWRAKKDELLDQMRDAGVPKDRDLGLKKARQVARERGVKFKNNVFTEAFWEAYCAQPGHFVSTELGTP